jgi:pimeloyl-ACP methyl ester carboxylesterase
MREVALEAVKAGHKAISFDYSNKGNTNVMLSNAVDCAAVIDALPDDTRRKAIGLSMGGSVVTRAILQATNKLEAATLVAPAQYITRHPTAMEVARRLAAEGRELPSLYLNPLHALRLGAGIARNCAERPRAVVAELSEMLSGTVHSSLESIKADPAAPYMRFMYGLGDHLLPAEVQLEGVEGLPFDQIVSYGGGHVQLARRNRQLAQTIFELDAEQTPLQTSGELSLAA